MSPRSILLLSSLAILLGTGAAAQPAPRVLPFQGGVMDASGLPVPDGPRVIRFRISESPVDHTFKWAGELHRATVNGGLINVVLGSKTPMEGVDFGKQCFLEVTVDSNNDGAVTEVDAPMLPRQAILPVLFAHEAENSRKLGGHDWTALLANGANDPSVGFLSPDRIGLGSIRGMHIAAQGIGSTQLAHGAVRSEHMMAGAISSSQIATGSVQLTHLAPRPIAVDAPMGGLAASVPTYTRFTADFNNPVQVDHLSTTLTTTGRPVLIALMPGDAPDKSVDANPTFLSFLFVNGSTQVSADLAVMFVRGDTPVGPTLHYSDRNAAAVISAVYVPPSAFQTLDMPPAGRHTYRVRMGGRTGQLGVFNVRLVAIEL